MANNTLPYSRIIIKNMEVQASVGIYDHEKQNTQKLIINIEVSVDQSLMPENDSFQEVLNYEFFVETVETILNQGHSNLLETVATRILDECLSQKGVLDAKVKVEKPDIFECMQSVAVELFRSRA